MEKIRPRRHSEQSCDRDRGTCPRPLKFAIARRGIGMNLYVLRHAEAEERGPGGDDGARRLTVRGKARTREAAKGLQRLGVKCGIICTSPVARASETAAIVAAAYNNDPSPQVLADLASGVAPAQLVTALTPFTRRGDLMIVGHEPQLSELVSLLLTGSPDILH